MKPQRTRAFVLKTVDYGERDVIVTLLGRDTGRFTAIARSAKTSRRRFIGGLEPLRCLEASFTRRAGSDLATLVEVMVVGDYPGLETELEKITAASYATELVRELSREGAESARTFDLLEAFYAHVSQLEGTLELEMALRHFELRLLDICGAMPSLRCCARCGLDFEAMDRLACSRAGEGLICDRCRHAGEALGTITAQTLRLLQDFEEGQFRAPASAGAPVVYDDATLAEAGAQARRVIEASLAQVVPGTLRSKAMLTTLGLG